MKVLHVVPGLDEANNGIAVAAKLIAREIGADMIEARLFAGGDGDVSKHDEVWVHSAWLPMVLRSCWRVLRAGKRLVRMAHANYDPVRLKYHVWKKRLVAPIDRYFLRNADEVVATCQAEADWIRAFEPRVKSIGIIDLKSHFNLSRDRVELAGGRPLHLLYLGRCHPLKGLEYLEAAVRQIQGSTCATCSAWSNKIELKIVSNAFGEEKERVWNWCDALILPTISDNFGLVIAEALERGKRVITTDGAPAWRDDCNEGSGMRNEELGEGKISCGYDGMLVCVRGYRDGTPEERIQLLKSAIENLCHAHCLLLRQPNIVI